MALALHWGKHRDSGWKATKCLAKYQLIKAICYKIIQNKSWLTYLLKLFLKEIIHKAERCETVNIIYIDWEENSSTPEETEIRGSQQAQRAS